MTFVVTEALATSRPYSLDARGVHRKDALLRASERHKSGGAVSSPLAFGGKPVPVNDRKRGHFEGFATRVCALLTDSEAPLGYGNIFCMGRISARYDFNGTILVDIDGCIQGQLLTVTVPTRSIRVLLSQEWKYFLSRPVKEFDAWVDACCGGKITDEVKRVKVAYARMREGRSELCQYSDKTNTIRKLKDRALTDFIVGDVLLMEKDGGFEYVRVTGLDARNEALVLERWQDPELRIAPPVYKVAIDSPYILSVQLAWRLVKVAREQGAEAAIRSWLDANTMSTLNAGAFIAALQECFASLLPVNSNCQITKPSNPQIFKRNALS